MSQAVPKPGRTAGKGDALLHPFPGGDGVSSLRRRWKQKQRRADGASRTSSRLFAFWPRKHSRSRELLPTQEKRKGWAKGPWHRAAVRAREAALSSAAGRQPCGWHFGRGLGHPFAEAEASGSTAACWDLNHELSAPPLAVAQHTPAAPNIWHSQAAASEGRQHPTTNPA